MKYAALAVCVVGVALAAAAADGTTDRLGLSSFSNSGRAAGPVAPVMDAELRRAGASVRGRVLARRGGKTFMVFTRAENGDCYGIRKRDAARFSFTCWADFPSPAHPILDQSVFGADTGEPIHLIDAQGFAADGVAAVAVEDATGTAIARAPVVDNVYALPAAPRAGVRLVALDASGRVLFAVPR